MKNTFNHEVGSRAKMNLEVKCKFEEMGLKTGIGHCWQKPPGPPKKPCPHGFHTGSIWDSLRKTCGHTT